MVKALKSRDMDTVQNLFKSLLSAIPGEWYMNNQLDRYEGYYASVVYAFLASLGFDLRPEESSSHGRCDLVVDTREVVYIIEFKVTELTGDGQSGLEQIRSRGYHDQYVQAGREVILVGMDFSKKERNLTGFAVESC
jgi:predicted type IV restriction endonuclease